MIDPFVFSGRSIGPAAACAIASGTTGTVAAVFTRSFYLCSSEGHFACIGPDTIGNGPLNMLVDQPSRMDWAASGCVVGTPWSRADGRLRIGPGLAIDLSAVARWHPVAVQEPDVATAAKRLHGLAATARGLGRLMGDPAGDLPHDDALFRAARPGIAALRASLACSNAALDNAALDLIGLGPGLTPAGDDVIGGVLIALHALGMAPLADRLADAILPAARSHTTSISLAHLACAADGLGASAVHELLTAVCGADDAALGPAIAAIDGIGHSSGWDAALGLSLVLDALADGRQ